MTSSSQFTRRSVLYLAGLSATVGALGLPMYAEHKTALLLSPRAPRAPHIDPFRPIRVSDPRELPHFPENARPVWWHWPRSSHTTIQDAVATLKPNDVLVLPEDDRPFEIDSSHGFRRDGRHYYSMASLQRGLVGLGPGAVVQPSASAFRQGRQTYSRGMQEKMIECRAHHAYLGNFTMYGRDFGGVGYNATRGSGDGTVWERIYFRGAHRGWLSRPPGESGAICGYRGSGMQVYNCEVDCRDQSGRSVGPSPMMWNVQSDLRIVDAYCHHTYVGMPTFWRVRNATATNLIHTNVAQGLPHSAGVNVEECSGHFQFENCTFIIDYGPHNTDFHLQSGGQRSSIRFDVSNPTIDAGPWPGYFSIQSSPTTVQRISDIHVTRADGSGYPFHVAGL